MGLYSEKILEQMGQIGEPIRTTAKTTVKPPGPAIDIMQLLMMLMFSGAFQQKGGQKDLGPLMGIQQPDFGLMGGAAPGAPWTPPTTGTAGMGGMGGTGDLAGLMKILMSIPGMGGIPGT